MTNIYTGAFSKPISRNQLGSFGYRSRGMQELITFMHALESHLPYMSRQEFRLVLGIDQRYWLSDWVQMDGHCTLLSNQGVPPNQFYGYSIRYANIQSLIAFESKGGPTR